MRAQVWWGHPPPYLDCNSLGRAVAKTTEVRICISSGCNFDSSSEWRYQWWPRPRLWNNNNNNNNIIILWATHVSSTILMFDVQQLHLEWDIGYHLDFPQFCPVELHFGSWPLVPILGFNLNLTISPSFNSECFILFGCILKVPISPKVIFFSASFIRLDLNNTMLNWALLFNNVTYMCYPYMFTLP